MTRSLDIDCRGVISCFPGRRGSYNCCDKVISKQEKLHINFTYDLCNCCETQSGKICTGHSLYASLSPDSLKAAAKIRISPAVYHIVKISLVFRECANHGIDDRRQRSCWVVAVRVGGVF